LNNSKLPEPPSSFLVSTEGGTTPPRRLSAEARRLALVERENEKLRHRLKQAETIIEFQKKVHEILGIPLKDPPEGNVRT
jgi:hypothetical protein